MASVLGNTAAAPPEAHRAARGHLPALDGLRGVAILLVLLTHAVALPLEPTRTMLDATAYAWARIGWTGVDLFFVLSGFLITGILLDTKNEPRRWKRFYARRALRIFPLYYGLLVGIFVIGPLVLGNWQEPEWHTLQNNQPWYWLYGVNFLELATKGAGTPFNTVHFWSLSIEEQFYIFWPFVVFALRPKSLLRLAAVVAVLGLLARVWIAVADPFNYAATSYVLTPLRLDGLMMGGVLAVLAREPGGLIRFRKLAPIVAATGGLALTIIGIWREIIVYTDPVISTIGFPLIAVTYGALLVTVITSGAGSRVSRVFSCGFLRSWGKYSYGIYVFHYILIGAFGWFLPIWAHDAPWLGGSRLPAVLLFAIIVAALSFGIAWLSYNLYEKRFLSLKRYFEREPVRVQPVPEPATALLPGSGAARLVRPAPEA